MATLPCDATASDICGVAQVFSDIPFISVGILVFGVSVLFLFLKRLPLSAIFLFSSVLLAFVAAVLDSSQILANGSAINTSLSSGTVRAREVLLASSIGFRFLFYWSYAAEPSRRHPSAAAAQGIWKIDFPILRPTQEPHSGSWLRWGLPGKLAAAGVLVAIIVVTALQIVWRVVPQFHQYSNIYATDAVLELLVSFLILLKLLSDTTTLGSVDVASVHTFSEYLVPIFGLLFNIAIGVGNLLRFAFTESMVGRLLRALEIFLIVVSVMVTAFLRHRDISLSTGPSQGTNHHGDVVFTLPEPVRGSTFRITPPVIETPRMSTVLGASTQSKESRLELLLRPTRRSSNHLSSWLSSRISRSRSRREDDEVKLWDTEKVKGGHTNTGEMDAALESSTQASRRWSGCASANHTTAVSAVDVQSARSLEDSSRNGRTLRASQLDIPQRTVSLRVRTDPAQISPVALATTGAKHAENMTVSSEGSPVYGLSGVRSLASDCSTRMSLDELLRQQSELDKSIEALRSLSAATSNAVPNHRSTQLSRSPSTGQKTVCSEVSLSNFPIPPGPAVPIPSLPSTRSSPIQRIRGDRRVLLAAARSQDNHGLAPLRTLATLAGIPNFPHINSIPHTPTGEENETLSAEAGQSSHADGGGVEYNVTSFIGDLATPGGSNQSQEKLYCPADNASDCGISSDSSSRPPEKPHAKPSPLARLSWSRPGTIIDEHANVMHQTTCPLTIPRITVTEGAEAGMSRSQAISQPVQDSRSTEGDGRARKMFVRRRPARLSIQTYNPGISRVEPVQVLDDS